MEVGMNWLKKMVFIILTVIFIFNVVMVVNMTNVLACGGGGYCTASEVVQSCKYRLNRWDCPPGDSLFSDCAGVVSNEHHVLHSSVTCVFLNGLTDDFTITGNTQFTGNTDACHTSHLVYIRQNVWIRYNCANPKNNCGIDDNWTPGYDDHVKRWN
jgi:hypothetical protein